MKKKNVEKDLWNNTFGCGKVRSTLIASEDTVTVQVNAISEAHCFLLSFQLYWIILFFSFFSLSFSCKICMYMCGLLPLSLLYERFGIDMAPYLLLISYLGKKGKEKGKERTRTFLLASNEKGFDVGYLRIFNYYLKNLSLARRGLKPKTRITWSLFDDSRIYIR